ncbi:MAG: preprotein translocase subunit SecE [Lachnospiraceae bacterium]|nr:preprotein translocase subunit SecE [Lachnospiraceae bacterium]
MADEKKNKQSRFEALKLEFGKIVWPNGSSVAKQTVATVVVSVVLGLIIALIDTVVQYGVDILMNL